MLQNSIIIKRCFWYHRSAIIIIFVIVDHSGKTTRKGEKENENIRYHIHGRIILSNWNCFCSAFGCNISILIFCGIQESFERKEKSFEKKGMLGSYFYLLYDCGVRSNFVKQGIWRFLPKQENCSIVILL